MGHKDKKYNLNDKGQVTVDYLISITIFVFTIFFVFQYLSGLFTPFESNSDEVTLIADRVSTQVVEAIMSEGDVATSNFVTSTKVDAFFAQLNGSYDDTRAFLGLMGTYIEHDVNITIEKNINGSSVLVNSSGQILPSIGNVGQTKRIILFMNDTTGITDNRILSVRVW